MPEPEHPQLVSINRPSEEPAMESLHDRVQAVMDDSLTRQETSLAVLPLDDPSRPTKHFELGLLHGHHNDMFDNIHNLQASIYHFEQALATTSGNFSDHFRAHVELTGLVRRLYVLLGSPSDLDAALKYARAAVAESHPGERAICIYQLSCILKDRYRLLGDLSALDGAIENSEAALVGMFEGTTHRADVLYDLSDHYIMRYSELDVAHDLDEAIRYAEMTAGELLFDDPARFADRGSVIDTLSEFYLLRYLRFKEQVDLAICIMNAGAALDFAPLGHPKRRQRFSHFSTTLGKLYIEHQYPPDLEYCIEYAEEAQATPGDDSDTDKMLYILSIALEIRYDKDKNLGDLQLAIKHAATVIATADGDLQLGNRFIHLSRLLRTRFDRLGEISDSNAAAEFCAAAILHLEEALFENDGDRMTLLNMLSTQLYNRSERTGGSLSDLEEAIEYCAVALNEAPEGYGSRRIVLHLLARCYRARYNSLGVLGDLETSIQHVEESLAVLPSPNQSIKEQNIHAETLYTLSTCLDERYKRLGARSDNNASISHARASVAATSTPSDNHALRLQNLSKLLSLQYHRDRVPGDLPEIIEFSEKALLATSADHYSFPRALYTLAMNLRYRYYLQGAVADMDEAVEYARIAFQHTPQGHMDYRTGLCNLGNLLRTRYSASGNLSDLDEAVNLTKEAVANLPIDHNDRHNLFTITGCAFRDRYKATGSEEDRQQAFSHLLVAFNSNLASPLLRVVTARDLVADFQSLQTLDESSSMLEEAVLLIPKISLRFLGREDLQYLLSKISGLPSEAASFSLEAGHDAYHALKLLELGRGIITGFGIDSRSELSELEGTHPNLSLSFNSLQAKINTNDVEPQDAMTFNSNIHFSSMRMQATLDLETLLEEIRQIPAYERFLLPLAPADLMKTAECGAIVVLNSTDLRSDAIIVRSSGITALALPKLVYPEAKERMLQISQFVKGKRSSYPERTKKMKDFLAWLWDVVVEPVLAELQPDGLVHGACPPRVWWIGAGVLGRAPFHAAGRDHSAHSTSNTLNRVLSSYIPTVKALAYARQKPLNLVTKSDAQLLLVVMPTTPGSASLPGVEQEIADIVAIIENNGMAKITVLTQPSSSTVLNRLQLSDAVHFACHGVSDSSNPSNSRLLLLDSTSPATVDKLTAHMISQADTKNAQVAYLSACYTADNPAVALADEMIHLASAFQLAGFNHVLATMWQSHDSACMRVAKDFYGYLFDGQLAVSEDSHYRVSMALHVATKRLRDQGPDKPLIWAPFIHTGA